MAGLCVGDCFACSVADVGAGDAYVGDEGVGVGALTPFGGEIEDVAP